MSQKKRESVIFRSKLKRFNCKEAALFGYHGLCYCARLAVINEEPFCLLIDTSLGSAVITRTTRRLPKELVEEAIRLRSTCPVSMQSYSVISFRNLDSLVENAHESIHGADEHNLLSHPFKDFLI